MTDIFPQTAPVHQLQKNYRSLINKAKEIKGPLYLLKNNQPESVLLDFDYWQKLTGVQNTPLVKQPNAPAVLEALKNAKGILPTELDGIAYEDNARTTAAADWTNKTNAHAL